MVRFLFMLAIWGVTGSATAEPLVLANWQIQLQARPPGQAAEGKALFFERGCPACHGNQGISEVKGMPVVAGQRDAYLFKILLDYQSGRVEGATLMQGLLNGLDVNQLSNLSAWISTLSRPKPSRELPPPAIIEGDRARLIPACESCHGADGQGWAFQPAIRGQDRKFLETVLTQFKSGARSNDLNASMRFIARTLTDDEIKRLAGHYGR